MHLVDSAPGLSETNREEHREAVREHFGMPAPAPEPGEEEVLRARLAELEAEKAG